MSLVISFLEGLAIGCAVLGVCLLIPRIFDGEWYVP